MADSKDSVDLTLNQAAFKCALANLIEVKATCQFAVALSGGMDSIVLLNLMCGLRREFGFDLRALHFDHAMQSDSVMWATFCRQQAHTLGVDFATFRGEVDAKHRDGVEAAARQARYNWFRAELHPQETLLTAHHADDQVETILLGILRQGSTRQMAGIPSQRNLNEKFGNRVARPLLSFPYQSVRAYADKNDLKWIEDPSNQDTRYDRNFLRQSVLPSLEQRWPDYRHATLQVGRQFALQANALDERAATLLRQAVQSDQRRALCLTDPLSISELLLEQDDLINHAIRIWLHQCGIRSPGNRRLQELVRQLRDGKTGGGAIELEDVRIERYRQWLFLYAPVVAPFSAIEDWSTKNVYPLNDRFTLVAEETAGRGISDKYLNSADLRLVWSESDNAPELVGVPLSHSMKKRYQSRAIPHWERACLPKLTINNELIWMHGVEVPARFAAVDSDGWTPRIKKRQ